MRRCLCPPIVVITTLTGFRVAAALTLALAVVGVAAEAGKQELLLDGCESAEGWSGGLLKITHDQRTEGDGSLCWKFVKHGEDWVVLTKKWPRPMDLSEYSHFAFDVRVDTSASAGWFGVILTETATGRYCDPYASVEKTDKGKWATGGARYVNDYIGGDWSWLRDRFPVGS